MSHDPKSFRPCPHTPPAMGYEIIVRGRYVWSIGCPGPALQRGDKTLPRKWCGEEPEKIYRVEHDEHGRELRELVGYAGLCRTCRGREREHAERMAVEREQRAMPSARSSRDVIGR